MKADWDLPGGDCSKRKIVSQTETWDLSKREGAGGIGFHKREEGAVFTGDAVTQESFMSQNLRDFGVFRGSGQQPQGQLRCPTP